MESYIIPCSDNYIDIGRTDAYSLRGRRRGGETELRPQGKAADLYADLMNG